VCSSDLAFAEFVASHGRLLEWGVVIIGVGVLLIAPPLPTGTILLAIAATVAFVGAVEFIAATTTKKPASETADS
jgi:membrane protein implicated in regulation of membrane protease activity